MNKKWEDKNKRILNKRYLLLTLLSSLLVASGFILFMHTQNGLLNKLPNVLTEAMDLLLPYWLHLIIMGVLISIFNAVFSLKKKQNSTDSVTRN